MPFAWKEYLKFSLLIIEEIKTEASYRSGVSRSYYSVYGAARLLCINHLKIITTSEAAGPRGHTLITDKLIEQNNFELELISHKISALRLRRHKADYDAFEKVDYPYAAKTIKDSQEVLELIEEQIN